MSFQNWKLSRFSISLVVSLVLSCLPLAAQQITGSISGTVADKSGSVIAGATVKLTSQATASVRETKTDAEGNFRFSALPAGTYKFTTLQPGFKSHEQKDMELTPNQNLSVGTIKLQVGEVAESVTVTAEVATVQTASGERSGIITSDEVENLTIMNRDFAGLVALLPGVVDNPGDAEVQGFAGGASFNVGGNRSNANSITIDGGSIENSNGGNGNNFVSIDSVQAVRIVTSNYQAEFGRKPGAGIMAVTKGGSQSFHGSAFWNYRHEWMNANQFFNNRLGVAPTPRRVQTPGYTIGGPLYIPGKFNRGKNKLFFFHSLEFIRERRPQAIRNLTMPTAEERMGDFSNSLNSTGGLPKINDPLNNKLQFPGNIIPASRINANGQNYLKLLPLPNDLNDPKAKFAYNYLTQESLVIPKTSTNNRIDYILNDKTTIWFKINHWFEDQRGWAVSAGNANWGWLPSHYVNYTYAPVLTLTRIISPRLILEASARVTRWVEDGSILNDSDYTRLNRKASGVNIPQFWPANNPHGIVPAATFGGIIANSPNTSYATRFPLRGAETPFFSDAALTSTHGSHVTKYGIYLERWKAIKGEQGNWAGTLDFTQDTNNTNDANHPFANALLGNFKSYTESNTRPPLYEATTSLEWFVQDNWKVTRKLTLDLGMRMGWSQPWHSIRRQEAGFVPSLWDPKKTIQLMTPVRVNNVRKAQNPITGELYPLTIIGAIAPGTGDPYNGTMNLLTDSTYPQGLRENSGIKFAPRFGFAYDPTGKGQTAIRGGFGLFYELHERDLFAYALERDPPNQLTPQIFYGDLATFISSTGFVFPSNTSGLNRKRNLPRTMGYSFGVQHQLMRNTILDASYVGTLGRHLTGRTNLNSIPAGTTQLESSRDPSNPTSPIATQYLRPYLGYGDILYYDYNSNSSYHSLQVTANRRMKRMTAGLAYTWSKAMDYADNDTTTLSSLVSPKIWNYGLAGYDRTHILKGNWVFEIPKGSRMLPKDGAIASLGKAVLDGWRVSGIVTMMSGAPQGVTLALSTGSNTNWSGSPTDAARPNLIGVPNLPKSERTFYTYFNTAAFGIPNNATLGNAAKYVMRGPGRNNWDISMFKDFRVTERFRASFRCESYNTFNHTQFSAMDVTAKFDINSGAQTSPTFGNVTAAQLARRMQLALRVNF